MTADPNNDPMPALAFAPAPCPTCGAQTEDQAGEICRPSSDETGERYCAGEFNDAGQSVQPTPESIAALDDWYGRRMPTDETPTET